MKHGFLFDRNGLITVDQRTPHWLGFSLATVITLAPAVRSHDRQPAQPIPSAANQEEEVTRFVPEGHQGVVCMALSPQCMTKQQWAAYCLNQTSAMDGSFQDITQSKSCRDALDGSKPNPEEP